MTDAVTIKLIVPETESGKISAVWRELRIAEGLSAEFDLKQPQIRMNFDTASMAQWTLQALPIVTPMLVAIFGYLIAARGELTVERGGEKITMKNLKPSQVRDLMKELDKSKVE